MFLLNVQFMSMQMPENKILLILSLLFTILPLYAGSKPANNLPTTRASENNSGWQVSINFQEFEREITDFMKRWGLPGGSVALLKDGWYIRTASALPTTAPLHNPGIFSALPVYQNQ